MSVSRKNWAALSSLARQWTMEDEEELEREQRRKTRDPSVSGEPEEDEGQVSARSPGGSRSVRQESSERVDEDAQMQMDFVEMLRSRDEKRRARHVETLRRQKQEEDGAGAGGGEGDQAEGEPQARVELLGDVEVEEAFITPLRNLLVRGGASSPSDPPNLASPGSPVSTTSSSSRSHSRTQSSNSAAEGQNGNGTATSTPSSQQRAAKKFVSSVSISFDKSPMSPPPQRLVSPLSPRSPMSPTFGSPSSSAQHNGGAENGSPSSFEPAERPAFIRQSSRTTSFRMLKKKEEQSMPLQRSASVRVTNKIESDKGDQDEEQQSPFKRNSKQRISARSIQETMDRLNQAAQKQSGKSPYHPERTLFLNDEVLRKKSLFEKEQQKGEKESGISRQEFRNFSSGIGDRINRWVQKQSKPSSSPSSSSEFRTVDFLSKKILFEHGKGERPLSPTAPSNTN
ncbi:ladinin-1 [Engraulis encrasicolus]|uniref:ladinin-1 n=1 Tax=Engraulis encrasicolus TaxID=184585 RepID=UPI002FD6C947